METQKLQRVKTKSTTRSGSFFKPVIQKKLSIGSANDSYEAEADNMANKVMRMREASPQNFTHTGALVQKKCAHCDEEEKLQMKPLAESITHLIQPSFSENGGQAPSRVESQINSSKGGGSNLDHGTKSFMENRFGTDFSEVRIHTGIQAVQMSRELNAQAFTVGNDIYFNEGKYNPNSESGKHLLAHELTHTVQQSGGIQRKVQFADVARGEASGMGRLSEIIDKLNGVSTGLNFTLSGTNELNYTLIPSATLSNFDNQIIGFIDNAQSVKLRLTNHSGLLGDKINGFNAHVDGDAFTSGYVDVDDLLAGSDMGFQMLFVHILRERMSVRRYNERIGSWTQGQFDSVFPRAHSAGIDSETQILRDLFNDPSIRLISDSPSSTVRRIFRNCHGDLIRRRISSTRGVDASFIDIVDRNNHNAIFSERATAVGSRIEDYKIAHPNCPA